MSSINPETVVSVLKDQIENYDQKTEVKEEGRIIQIADGIATVYGMDQAMYGELVIFETGYFEFLYEQTKFIKKRWWILQVSTDLY